MTRSQKNYSHNNKADLAEVEYSTDTDINVGVIFLAVTAVVLILVAIFFIKTYASQKQDLVKIIKSENKVLEIALKDSFTKNQFLIGTLASSISQAPQDYENILRKFKALDDNDRRYKLFESYDLTWIDTSLQARVSNIEGIINRKPKISEDSLIYSKSKPGKTIYWTDLSTDSPLVHSFISVQDQNGEFTGIIAISYDAEKLNESLAKYKRHDATNFIILDRHYRVIMQSKPILSGIGVQHGQIKNPYTESLIKSIKISDKTSDSTSYIDMLNGTNYYIKQMKSDPFILLTSFEKSEVRNMIFNSVVMKFLEISIFASMFLLLIVAIYKRETWLRAKAEKAYEFASKATEAKSDFLAFTAHEIRSPLGFIMTGSEIMCKKMLGPISDKYLEYLEGIHKSATLILDFINDILDEEQIIAGNFKIIESEIQLKDILDEAISQNQSRYAHRQVEINLSLAKQLPSISCDAKRILQVVNNLVSNSIKYSDKAAKIDISAKMLHGELVLKIQDHGVGMSENDIKIALTKFGTVRKTSHTLIEGFGLGLVIVKLLLDAHEASFALESTENVGTIVTITFPSYRLVQKPKKRKKKNEKQ